VFVEAIHLDDLMLPEYLAIQCADLGAHPVFVVRSEPSVANINVAFLFPSGSPLFTFFSPLSKAHNHYLICGRRDFFGHCIAFP